MSWAEAHVPLHPLCLNYKYALRSWQALYKGTLCYCNPKIELKETLAYVYDYDYELGFTKAPLTCSRVDQGSPSCLVFEFY